ncbi:uncharacterized protein LOC130967084 [Arachis stenosperma]|uniref:uncharacterized protein LOC130967084 n=1 Tax=Arachis stenosperma TaxID=217475 RepID=UPI0025AC5CE9|nr:uncharacterized protein LOC130967084 [Arachis stenosperma]
MVSEQFIPIEHEGWTDYASGHTLGVWTKCRLVDPNEVCGEEIPWLNQSKDVEVETLVLLRVELTDVPWKRFKTEFYGRYFLHAFRIAKELELMQLKQKDMSIADYTREFDNLCRFSKTCQGNPADYEEWKCAQYEKGLRRDIFNYVYPQKLTNFTELVKKIQLAEDCSMKWTLLQEGFGETTPEEPHRAGLRMCFRYRAPGHMSRDCP